MEGYKKTIKIMNAILLEIILLYSHENTNVRFRWKADVQNNQL